MCNNILLVADADNTLWETDSIYAEAQLELLEQVEKFTKQHCNATDRLSFVRTLDQRIALRHELHLQYPPELLAFALIARLAGASDDDAIRTALSYTVTRVDGPIADRARYASEAFLAKISREVPRLRAGVAEFFGSHWVECVRLIVATEARSERCMKFLRAHRLDSHVHAVESGSKDAGLYATIARGYPHEKKFAVGDQLDRDVKRAKEAGFVTIYFRGSFEPHWLKAKQDISPDFQISSFLELGSLLSPMSDCRPTSL